MTILNASVSPPARTIHSVMMTLGNSGASVATDKPAESGCGYGTAVIHFHRRAGRRKDIPQALNMHRCWPQRTACKPLLGFAAEMFPPTWWFTSLHLKIRHRKQGGQLGQRATRTWVRLKPAVLPRHHALHRSRLHPGSTSARTHASGS